MCVYVLFRTFQSLLFVIVDYSYLLIIGWNWGNTHTHTHTNAYLHFTICIHTRKIKKANDDGKDEDEKRKKKKLRKKEWEEKAKKKLWSVNNISVMRAWDRFDDLLVHLHCVRCDDGFKYHHNVMAVPRCSFFFIYVLILVSLLYLMFAIVVGSISILPILNFIPDLVNSIFS